MMGVEQYERLCAEASDSIRDGADLGCLGGLIQRRRAEPRRPRQKAARACSSPTVPCLLRCGMPTAVLHGLLAVAQRERPSEQIVQDGQAALERARQQAMASGTAIDDEVEAACGDCDSMHRLPQEPEHPKPKRGELRAVLDTNVPIVVSPLPQPPHTLLPTTRTLHVSAARSRAYRSSMACTSSTSCAAIDRLKVKRASDMAS